MSEQAASALIGATSRKQGQKVTADVGTEWELIDAGLIGKGGGLTRKGTIERERAMRKLEDEAFGL